MVEQGGSKTNEPRKYFSTLYYQNQIGRTTLPTVEEQAELDNLKTNYEGMRFQIPTEMENVLNPREQFKEIDHQFQTFVNQRGDMRWFREHTLNQKSNDYDYRYWLQYQVEEISAGNRSMRLLRSRSKEFRDAMSKLSTLSMDVAEILYSMCYDVVNSEITNNIHPLAHLIEINDTVRSEARTLFRVRTNHFQFEDNSDNEGLKQYIEQKPLFYHLANATLMVFFKSIRRSTRIKNLRPKQALVDALQGFAITDVEGKTANELQEIFEHQLHTNKHRDEFNKYYVSKFVCETNSFFRKLLKRCEKILTRWSKDYYFSSPRKINLRFFRTLYLNSRDDGAESLNDHAASETKQQFRKIAIKTATSCLFSTSLAGLINFDSAAVDELDSLYDAEYEHAGTSYPNVIRMSSDLFSDLNKGDHAIIRHFQMDAKRNMYCLPSPHIPFEPGTRGRGGFLHNDAMTVSLHPALLNLIEEGRLTDTRFEPAQETINALNILQNTQWSVNLDFLDFIADFTLDGEIISPYPLDIRQSAWQRSNNMKLRDVFIDKMDLLGQDEATKAKFRNVNANLKQARKNLYNAGNVFWHPWFCDWRGRFNTKVNELSPQGDDLSKALLLFTEWKPLGDKGQKWLYVRAYELLKKIFDSESQKLDDFSEQVEWVEHHLKDIIRLGRQLNRHTPVADLNHLLDKLEVKKPGPKSEIFQRIAFLIEFTRIHREHDIHQDWNRVTSGLPIHLDASCNGFQHIAALTRNKKLAKSVNLLNNPGNKKGDLYQEVAVKAKQLIDSEHDESKLVRQLIDTICSTNESKNILIDGIFTRDFCKPLVMITGYGASDLASQIMNLNGKKRRGGRFKPSKKANSVPTLHQESLLYQVIQRLQEEHGGFDKLMLVKDNRGYMTPTKNCQLAREFGLALGTYIRYCIGVVTEFEFEVVKNKLAEIYRNIDTLGIKTPPDISRLDEMTSESLRKILFDNGLPSRKLDKQARLTAVRQLVVDKWKNKLYFSWRAANDSSTVRYIKWKLDHNRAQATLPTAMLPKNYVDPGDTQIEHFILNSPSLTNELKERLRKQQRQTYQSQAKKGASNQSQSGRKLKNLVLLCLRNIVLRSTDDNEKQQARSHYAARFIELRGKRTTDGKKNGHRFSLDTGNDMKFNTKTKKEFKQSVAKLFELSNEIILGMVPNFIHSFDALHMQKVIIRLYESGTQDIWAVHDSFGAHPCDIETLIDIVKDTFVELHKHHLPWHLGQIINQNAPILDDTFLGQNSGAENKYPENEWINDVLDANYLIS